MHAAETTIIYIQYLRSTFIKFQQQTNFHQILCWTHTPTLDKTNQIDIKHQGNWRRSWSYDNKNMPWKNFQISTDTPKYMPSTQMKKFDPSMKPLQLNCC